MRVRLNRPELRLKQRRHKERMRRNLDRAQLSPFAESRARQSRPLKVSQIPGIDFEVTEVFLVRGLAAIDLCQKCPGLQSKFAHTGKLVRSSFPVRHWTRYRR